VVVRESRCKTLKTRNGDVGSDGLSRDKTKAPPPPDIVDKVVGSPLPHICFGKNMFKYPPLSCWI